MRTALLGGTLVVGVLDMLDALIFFGLRGVPPVRILQSVAAGVLGRDAFLGGAGAASLGLFLHFVIAFLVVSVYFAVSRHVPALTRRPFFYGPLYGLAVYFVMQWVVIPLSAAVGAQGMPPLPVFLNGLLIHAFGVGLPSALFARAAFRR